MKKHLFMTGILVCVLVIGAGTAHAQTLITLDEAIQGAVEEFSYELRRGSRVAIVYMRSGSARMSNHLIEEMTSIMVSQRIFTVVDRAQLDLIQDEMNFQMSGEVSDSSALAIGQKLGARYIVTGRLEPIGDYYRFRVRVIEVETAVVQVTYSANVQNDRTVVSLLGSGGAHTSTTTETTNKTTTDWKWGGTVRFKPAATIVGLLMDVFEVDLALVNYVAPNVGIPVEFDIATVGGITAYGIMTGIEIIPVRHKEKSGLYLAFMGGTFFVANYFAFASQAHIGYQLVTDGGFVFTPAIGISVSGVTGISFDLMVDIGFAYRKR